MKGNAVAAVMEYLTFQRGIAPTKIRVGKGPEFISRAFDQWANMNKEMLDFSRPGKPSDNAFVEPFNGRFRGECLNRHWFFSLDDARGMSKGGAGASTPAVLRHLWRP